MSRVLETLDQNASMTKTKILLAVASPGQAGTLEWPLRSLYRSGAAVVRNGLLLLSAAMFVLLFWIVVWNLSCRLQRKRRERHVKEKSPKVGLPTIWGFYHPYCSAGGGGERVLWKWIEVLASLSTLEHPIQVVIYTVDPASPTYRQGV
jgi:ALG11 mannosyltransferase N-terminus